MTIVLVSVPILTFALGTWQVQRLGWKKELIKDLENKMALEPIGLPKHINPKVIPEFEYRKVKLTGRFDHSKEIFIESRTREGELGYHLITPFHPHNGGQPILVNRGFIKRQLKDPRSRPLSQESKDVVEVIGMLRKQESKSFFQPNNSKDSNQWYFVDIQEIAEHLETAPILVDAITYANSGKLNEMVSNGLPIGRSPQISLRNMHATYIATWYGLSAITSVMAIMLLRKPMSGKSRYTGIS
ncbi:surf-like protein [Puccinia graminis f. sp. tritici]|uniref:SURF1-like protein n=1 Tax=Puccinia graminis f. sp. tritici TaxID=56615 RepID=A0A5B0LU36_PUCGR|nr:surf-like protein [Puccinia graminis f. sp. tritici]